jgi:hypothetical protein
MQRSTDERSIDSTDALFRRIGFEPSSVGVPERCQNLFLRDPSTPHPLQGVAAELDLCLGSTGQIGNDLVFLGRLIVRLDGC